MHATFTDRHLQIKNNSNVNKITKKSCVSAEAFNRRQGDRQLLEEKNRTLGIWGRKRKNKDN